MKFYEQSLVAIFLVAAIGLVMCPSSTMAQGTMEKDPFGPKAPVDSDPFGAKAPAPGDLDPFGAKAADSNNSDPFGAKAPDSGDSDPFGPGTPIASVSANPTPAINRMTKPAISAETSVIRSRLNQKVDLVYDVEPFGDVLYQLREDLGINIVVDSNLEELDEDTEISANLSSISLAGGLRAMLKSVDATYTIKDGVLLIISIDDEGEPDYLTRHMIDVRGLLDLIKATEADRIGKPVAPGAKLKRTFGKVEAVVGGVVQVAPQAQVVTKQSQKAPATDKEDEQSKHVQLLTAEKILTGAITQIVAADSWAPNGSGNMDLTCVGGVLIVQASELVAGDVRSFVHDLEVQLKARGN